MLVHNRSKEIVSSLVRVACIAIALAGCAQAPTAQTSSVKDDAIAQAPLVPDCAVGAVSNGPFKLCDNVGQSDVYLITYSGSLPLVGVVQGGALQSTVLLTNGQGTFQISGNMGFGDIGLYAYDNQGHYDSNGGQNFHFALQQQP